jgi:hypothetical protein
MASSAIALTIARKADKSTSSAYFEQNAQLSKIFGYQVLRNKR